MNENYKAIHNKTNRDTYLITDELGKNPYPYASVNEHFKKNGCLLISYLLVDSSNKEIKRQLDVEI